MEEKKKPTRKPSKKKEAAKSAISPDQVLELLAQLGVQLPTAEAEDPEEEVEETVVETTEETAGDAGTQESEVSPAPPVIPAEVMVEVPNFLSLFVIGRLNRPDSPQHGQLFTKALGDMDLIRLAGMIEYAKQFSDKLWKDLLNPPKA